jgi:hypothetical protein
LPAGAERGSFGPQLSALVDLISNKAPQI